MNQGSYTVGQETPRTWHTVVREMPSTWQHLRKYLTAHLLNGYSIDIRLLFDIKSKNNRITNEEQMKKRACNHEVNTCQIRGNGMATVWQR